MRGRRMSIDEQVREVLKMLPKCEHIDERLNFYCSKCSLTAEIKVRMKKED